ncbi:Long-chain base-1-phosphate phosphatase [Coniosporium tulheliwenetii]|uniref:Long-chain base-1-phosphate phosphatase n=1 Tax=Coniosporium tulheliwenetii TaxID=3383036 RepID=A0ACC2ZA93_9PEZI|nr:Long-chain base-1-phosphate phosphatase [Cladosporium sp. JES 115]
MSKKPNGAGKSQKLRRTAVLPSAMAPDGQRYDAGMRDRDHLRWETPYLALMQEKLRTPALDSYFALTANLGTHTFFMVMLPILFWCGYTSLEWSTCLQEESSGVAFYWYAISIVIGRLYCGMHGFFDVVIGSLLGALLSVVQLSYGELFDYWICEGTYLRPLIATLITFVLVRIHPEPADDCPCFDDSVSFSGVFIGIQVGAWHFAGTRFALDNPIPGTVPFVLHTIGWPKTCIRILIGVLIIFAWRGTVKTLLLRILPPLFRKLEQLRMSLPRKFFLNASQYTIVPTLRKDDNVIPSPYEIPSLLTRFSHPRRKSISIGPQSMADAYETLAYRQNQRRESLSSPANKSPLSPVAQGSRTCSSGSNYFDSTPTRQRPGSVSSVERPLGANLLPTPASSRVHSYEQMMGTGEVDMPLTPPESNTSAGSEDIFAESQQDDGKEDQEIFSSLERPRVRYDVEVVTKLIVYSGIGWLAVEGNPILFELCGLGMGR